MPVRDSVADITWDDYARQVTNGGNELSLVSAASAGRFLCELYRDNPGALSTNPGILKPVFDARDLLLDKICGPQNLLPPPATSPFIGGQCENVIYEVRVDYKEAYNFNEQILERTQQVSSTFYGPIGSIKLAGSSLAINGSLAVKGFGWIDVQCRGGGVGAPGLPQTLRLGTAPSKISAWLSLENVRVTRVSGGADICGNPPPAYQPKISPVTNYNNTVNITNNANINVVAPITIIPTLIAPVGVVLKPEFNVDVGGVRFTFGTDGITFANNNPLPPGTDLPGDPRIIIPPSVENTYNEGDIEEGCDLTPVITKLEDIEEELQKCCDRLAPFPEPNTDEYNVATIHEGTGGTFNFPARTFTITVQVTNNPGNEKTINPISGPRVLFAGWVWFRSQGSLCTREPLDADVKAYKPPERADNSVTVSMYAGYTCKVVAWFAKPDA